MKVELSVIIVNYNGLKYLKECFESLYHNLSGISFEIIVIDNNSQDESCTYIKSNFPDIKLIASKINLGFGKGNNTAVKHAAGDYVLLINNDTVVLNPLLPVLNYLKSDKSIGVVGINMLNGKREYLTAFGHFPNVRNMFEMKQLLDNGPEFNSGKFEKEAYEVDWLGGSFLMLSRETYREIDGFDEDYFLYVEDVDFCKKIANRGLKRIFLPRYSYVHFVGFDKSKNPMLIKGYQIYISKHFYGAEKFWVTIALSVNKLVKNIKSLLKMD